MPRLTDICECNKITVDSVILWFRSPVAVVIMICDLFLFIKERAMDFSLFNKKKGLFNWDTEISLKACQVHNYQAGIRPQKRRRKSKKLKTSHVRRWRSNKRERSCTEMQCLVKMNLIHSQAQHKLFTRHSSKLFTYFMHLSNTKHIYWFLFFFCN